jgi:hypothetical protein
VTSASAPSPATSGVITPDALLQHWLGHRRLSRRSIEAFPEDQLFSFSVGGMRPYGAMALEMIGMGAPFIRGVVTGEWEPFTMRDATPKARVLELWDEARNALPRSGHRSRRSGSARRSRRSASTPTR